MDSYESKFLKKSLNSHIIKCSNLHPNSVHINLHLTASIAPGTASEPERAASPSYPMTPRADDDAPPTPGNGPTGITNFKFLHTLSHFHFTVVDFILKLKINMDHVATRQIDFIFTRLQKRGGT